MTSTTRGFHRGLWKEGERAFKFACERKVRETFSRRQSELVLRVEVSGTNMVGRGGPLVQRSTTPGPQTGMGPWSVRNWAAQKDVRGGNCEGAEHTWRCQQLGLAGVQGVRDCGEERGQTSSLRIFILYVLGCHQRNTQPSNDRDLCARI